MATKMGNSNVFLQLLLLLLASQWSSIHGRSMAGDYDTEIHTADFQQSNDDAVTFAAEWNVTQTDSPSFAVETDSPSYDGWDPVTFSSQDDTQTYSPETGLSEQADEQSLPYDTFIDSPEILQDAGVSSFGEEEATPYQSSDPAASTTPTAEAHANDEVYFDTSGADTVYKAKDE